MQRRQEVERSIRQQVGHEIEATLSEIEAIAERLRQGEHTPALYAALADTSHRLNRLLGEPHEP